MYIRENMVLPSGTIPYVNHDYRTIIFIHPPYARSSFLKITGAHLYNPNGHKHEGLLPDIIHGARTCIYFVSHLLPSLSAKHDPSNINLSSGKYHVTMERANSSHESHLTDLPFFNCVFSENIIDDFYHLRCIADQVVIHVTLFVRNRTSTFLSISWVCSETSYARNIDDIWNMDIAL